MDDRPPTSQGNFRLSSHSSALDSGDSDSNLFKTDFDGEERIQDGGIDMGPCDGVTVPTLIFADGFESGDTTAWSAVVGG